ncbi:MAG: cytochrome b [Pseudomonadota bacterium]
MARVASETYSTVAMVLHWLIALSIIGLIAAGTWMVDAIKVPETQGQAFVVYQFHKSLGLTVLVLSVARLAWRFVKPPPPLPSSMSGWERFAAHVSHSAFYVLMIGMPLLGWAMVSASPLGLPTIVFGFFEWPHIPYLANLTDKKPVEDALKQAHEAGGFILAVLLVLHVVAALKHHFVNKDNVLARMVPGVRAPRSVTEKEHA